MFQVLRVFHPPCCTPALLSPVKQVTVVVGGTSYLPGWLFPGESVWAQLLPDTALWEKGWKIRLCSASSHRKVNKSPWADVRFVLPSGVLLTGVFLLLVFKFKERGSCASPDAGDLRATPRSLPDVGAVGGYNRRRLGSSFPVDVDCNHGNAACVRNPEAAIVKCVFGAYHQCNKL